MSTSTNEEPLHVAIIDDVADHADLLRRSVENIASELAEEVVVHCYEDPARALAGLAGETHCVVLCDYKLDGCTAPEWIPYFVRSNQGPVLVATCAGDEQAAIETFHCGASDYLNKMSAISDPDYLACSIKEALRQHRLSKTVNDLTAELRRANRELEHKNTQLEHATQTAHAFVDDVAHDFRTPLTVIKEIASMIADGLDGPVTSEQTDHLRYIDRATDDLASMVDDFLDSARLRAGLLKLDRAALPTRELYDRVRPIIESRAGVKSIRLDSRMPESLPPVFCDESKAARILTNLAVNAVKFSPRDTAITISASEDDCWIRFAITDSGPGIRPDDLEKIFERFQKCASAHAESIQGFGLGRSIAHQLAAINFGRLEVESTPGAGSTFSVLLPSAEPNKLFDAYTRHLTACGETEPLALLRLTPKAPTTTSQLRAFLTDACWMNDLVTEGEGETLLLAGVTPTPSKWIERLELAAKHAETDEASRPLNFTIDVSDIVKHPYSREIVTRSRAIQETASRAAA